MLCLQPITDTTLTRQLSTISPTLLRHSIWPFGEGLLFSLRRPKRDAGYLRQKVGGRNDEPADQLPLPCSCTTIHHSTTRTLRSVKPLSTLDPCHRLTKNAHIRNQGRQLTCSPHQPSKPNYTSDNRTNSPPKHPIQQTNQSPSKSHTPTPPPRAGARKAVRRPSLHAYKLHPEHLTHYLRKPSLRMHVINPFPHTAVDPNAGGSSACMN